MTDHAAIRRPRHRALRRRHLPPADRRRPGGRRDVRQVPRRQRRQRRGRRGPAGQPRGADLRRRRRPVRQLRPHRAGRPRRRQPLRGDPRRVPDPGHVLRDLPAGQLPAVLLPQAQRAGPADPRRRDRRRRRPGRPAVLVDGHRPVRRAKPQRTFRRVGGARAGAADRARPRLPADVLGVARRRHRAGAARAAARHRRGRQPRGVRDRRRRNQPAQGRRRAAGPRRRAGDRQAGARAACSARPGTRSVTVAPNDVDVVNGLGAGDASAAACATACCTAGRWRRRCATPTPPAPSSRPGWSARPRCRPPPRWPRSPNRPLWRPSMSERHSAPTTPRSPICAPPTRARSPAPGRTAPPGPTVRGNGRLMIVAADHPARGALAVGNRPTAMNSRTDLLDRLRAALADPGVDGVLATAGHPRRPAAARRARGQGGVLVDEPRRPGRRAVRTRRPDDRRHRRGHRGGEDERRKDVVPHRSRRSRHGRDAGRVRAGRRRTRRHTG